MFEVEWYDAEKMEATAKFKGMPEGGSILDYVVDEQFRNTTHHAKWDDAVAKAREVQPNDFFGDTHINEQHLIQYKGGPTIWETVAVWLFAGDGDEPDPTAPHWTHKLDLQEGDEILAA